MSQDQAEKKETKRQNDLFNKTWEAIVKSSSDDPISRADTELLIDQMKKKSYQSDWLETDEFLGMLFPLGYIADVSGPLTYFSLKDDDLKKVGKFVEALRKKMIMKLLVYHNDKLDVKLDKTAPTEQTALNRFLKL